MSSPATTSGVGVNPGQSPATAFPVGSPSAQAAMAGAVASPHSLAALPGGTPLGGTGSYGQGYGYGYGVANAPSPATIFLQHGSQIPGPSSSLQPHHQLLQQQRLGLTGGESSSRPPPMSQAGSVVSSSLANTSADAPNEARKLIRMLLEPEGQGRLSLARIAQELATLQQDVNNAFSSAPPQDPSLRLVDLLSTLDELQIQLARTGLGAVKVSPAGQNLYSGNNIQSLIASTANEVQNNFKNRQRIRDGSGVAKSVLK